MVVVTRKVFTYGIRAGSTRDLGFSTGSVDMTMLIMLSLIELIVVVMMRSFQRMSEALISRMDREEARALTPVEVLPRTPAITGSLHCELEKVKFPEFFGSPDGAAAEAWLENMAMCFTLRDYTSNMKVRMAVFQLKGSALLWWKTLQTQLNMAVEDVSWELFEERFRERYLSEEFIERQLNEFNTLR
jgi:hypothetical protein